MVQGRIVEVRASPQCRAIWARVAEPREGDRVWIETSGSRQSEQADTSHAYLHTSMIGISYIDRARACLVLVDGTAGCTVWTGVAPNALGGS